MVVVEKYQVFDPGEDLGDEGEWKEVVEKNVKHMCKYWDDKIMKKAVFDMEHSKRMNPISALFDFKPEVGFRVTTRYIINDHP